MRSLARAASWGRAVWIGLVSGCRRPASLAAFALAFLASAPPVHPWFQGVVSAMAAVAAVGDLPAGYECWARPTQAAAWAFARSVFPLLGAAAGGGVRLLTANEAWPDGSALVAWMPLVVVLSTTASFAIVRIAGARSADAAGCGLAVTAAAAVTGLSAEPLVVAWPILSMVVAWTACRWLASEPAELSRNRGRTAWFVPLPGQGALRGRLTAIAMGACLAGMAGWLLREPPMVEPYARLVVGIFVALAVPVMMLGDGTADSLQWERVLLGPRRGLDRARAGPLPAAMATRWPPAARISFGHAAVVLWPVAVVGLVRGPLFFGSIASVAGLVVVLAAAAAGAARVLGRLGVAPETSQAVVFLLIAAASAVFGGIGIPSPEWS